MKKYTTIKLIGTLLILTVICVSTFLYYNIFLSDFDDDFNHLKKIHNEIDHTNCESLAKKNSKTANINTNKSIQNNIDRYKDWIIKDIERRQYFIHLKDSNSYQSYNKDNNLQTIFEPGAMTLKLSEDTTGLENWYLKMQLDNISFNENEIEGNSKPQVNVNDNNLQFIHNEYFTEEYINTNIGVRQNYIINKSPLDSLQTISVKLKVVGDLLANQVNENEIHFYKGNQTKIIYKDLKVWDSKNKNLKSNIRLENNEVFLDVVCSKENTFPITIDPLGTTITTLSGPSTNSYFGYAASSAGDVNGDGYSDVIVGAYGVSTNAGAVYLYYGSLTGLATTVSTTITGGTAGDKFGWSVATAGDVNGDGYSDIIVGTNTSTGKAYVFHGSASGLLSGSASGTVSSANTIITGAASSFFGYAVASAGDINADGYSDVVIGKYASTGGVYIFAGSSSGLLTGSQNYSYTDASKTLTSATSYYGRAVSGAGDVNGDTYADIVIGMTSNTEVMLGAASWASVSSFGGGSGVSSFGIAVSYVGDADNDGYSDVTFGENLETGTYKTGKNYLYTGGSSSYLWTLSNYPSYGTTPDYFGKSVTGADIDGDGFGDAITIRGITSNSFYAWKGASGAANIVRSNGSGSNPLPNYWGANGISSSNVWDCVNNAGDINGDGVSDVLFGCSLNTTNTGNVYIQYGSSLFNGLSSKPSTTFSTGVTGSGNIAYDMSSGDFNGDGYSDVIVGAPYHVNLGFQVGGVFVYYGSSSGLNATATVISGDQQNSYFGNVVSAGGDLNGDGFGDILVGAYFYDVSTYTNNGASFVFYGSSNGLLNGSTAGTVSDGVRLTYTQNNAYFGEYSSIIGDINADGYSDIAITASYLDTMSLSNNGGIFIFLGAASGINSTYSTLLYGDLNNTRLNMGAPAGDVNGDGYADLIASIVLVNKIYVYLSDGSTFSNTPSSSFTASGTILDSRSVGDVNGDGFKDVAYLTYGIASSGTCGCGMVCFGQPYNTYFFMTRVHLGSASGVSASYTDLTFNSTNVTSCLGFTLSQNKISSGDVNFDGYTDIYPAVVATNTTPYLFLGSSSGSFTSITNMGVGANHFSYLAGDVNGDGAPDGFKIYFSANIIQSLSYYNGGANRKLRLYNDNLTSPISASNITSSTFGIGLFAKTMGRSQKAKLQWEVKAQGQDFDGAGLSESTSYTTLALAGQELKESVTKAGLESKVRVRLKYDPASAIDGKLFGPWNYPSNYQMGMHTMNSTPLLNVPLPTELVSFKVNCNKINQEVNVKWQTASETNNDYFEIETSSNGYDWYVLEQIDGAGNSTKLNNYERNYKNRSEIAYYRLSQTDYNGQKETFPISSVECENQIEFTIYPNPFNNYFVVESKDLSEDTSFELYDITGKNVKIQIENRIENGCTLRTENLKPGQYIIKIITNNKSITFPISKN